MTAQALVPLADIDQKLLAEAVRTLEHTTFAGKIADYAGKPINRLLGLTPRIAKAQLDKIIQTAMLRCLDVAIGSFEEKPTEPDRVVSSLLAGLTGGLGGAFGIVALPIELPVTTTIMLRAIADIARREGEDLSQISARLACLEVFALSSGRTKARMDIGYYASRAMLARLMNEAAGVLLERGIAGATAPAVNSFLAEIGSRFGIVVSDKIGAGSIPILGAVGGATVNVMFMDYFQHIAEGHFAIRRLERIYGHDLVAQHYAALAANEGQALSPAKPARNAKS
jgi:hypothetical protein